MTDNHLETTTQYGPDGLHDAKEKSGVWISFMGGRAIGLGNPRTVWATNDGPAHRAGITVQQQQGVHKYSTLTPNADHREGPQ